MKFTRDGSDEMLRELVVYLTSRGSRPLSWTWEMVYHEEYNSNMDDIRVLGDGGVWLFGRIRDYTDDTGGFDELQRLVGVRVLFGEDEWGVIKASVSFMTCCETLHWTGGWTGLGFDHLVKS